METRTRTFDGYPLIDLELARRLERTEATANAAFVEARARLDPDIGAAWVEVAGVYAMFDGAASPITQTFGLGIFDPVGADQFAEIEAFFAQREAPVFHEVCPLIPTDTLSLLNERGYKPVEVSNVMIRPVFARDESAPLTDSIMVRRVSESKSDSGRGWPPRDGAANPPSLPTLSKRSDS